MKLLSINLARSIWLFSANDFNPRGKSLYTAVALLVDLYKFKKFPTKAEDLDVTKGINFEGGEFINKDGTPVSINLVVYNDGLIVDTRSSTKDTDDFVTDLLVKMAEKYGLSDHTQIAIKKLYVSQIYFTTDKHLETLNPKLKKISAYLSNIFNHPHELGSISFWADQTSPVNPQQFTFERVINKPFSENRYYSTSGLQTDDHLDLLSKLVDVLGS